jgi:hypothetical protein
LDGWTSCGTFLHYSVTQWWQEMGHWATERQGGSLTHIANRKDPMWKGCGICEFNCKLFQIKQNFGDCKNNQAVGRSQEEGREHTELLDYQNCILWDLHNYTWPNPNENGGV